MRLLNKDNVLVAKSIGIVDPDTKEETDIRDMFLGKDAAEGIAEEVKESVRDQFVDKEEMEQKVDISQRQMEEKLFKPGLVEIEVMPRMLRTFLTKEDAELHYAKRDSISQMEGIDLDSSYTLRDMAEKFNELLARLQSPL